MGLVPAEKTAGVAVAEATSKIAGQVAELGRLRDALAEAGSANASFTKGLAAALKFDKIGQDIVTTTGDIATMNQAFRQAASSGDAPGVATLAAGIDRATDLLKKLKQEAASACSAATRPARPTRRSRTSTPPGKARPSPG